ncbi:MAG: bifunctional [glutamate--ammonia ligase]-adenylyl-L-tyrosine phosphorylase/[glutamate--ammonia-ligase] adenylyltransferase [Thiohalocapsa sp.]|nr:bifunctional [glutamate--ammonia ligase]-adenylyl-L-tyrosine phosphorylase/[glutamate--ammonia-ligase] adenylyltransferase [Thiohalocapsa sp.]
MQNDPTNAAERHWQQWLTWAAEHGTRAPQDEAFEQARRQVLEASELAALTCARSPLTLAQLLADGLLMRRLAAGELDRELIAALADVADESALHRALRLFRRRHMLRIVWRDLSGRADLDETLDDLSTLADSCIARSLALLTAWTEAELGVPADADGRPQRLSVLGMGKLGARELNLSSDIDLIFAYPRAGEVTGGPRPLGNEQFFTRLCQRLIKALDSQSVDGFVFRVDTRLRPFGNVGPLAMSFDAMESYYHSQAREWERYAMIKARVVAGPPEDAAELTEMLRPFVYRRYLDFGAVESLRSLKAIIDRELKRKGMADNIKLGPGGIREIEFIGQSFQLIRGGRDPDLQIRPIQPVLALLASKGLIEPDAADELTAAYRFLRLAENRLQAWQDRQTHVLPRDDAAKLRLARSMGFADWTGFSEALEAHRGRVQAHFDNIFADRTPAAQEDLPLGALWSGRPDDARIRAAFAEAGFREPDEAARVLADFRDSVERRGLSTRGNERMALVMPRLLQAITDSDAPDLALPRVLRVLEAISGRTAYLSLLAEHPDAQRQLVLLCAKSPWFSERTAHHPLLLDELLDPRRLFEPLHRKELQRELDLLLGAVDDDDLEQRMERLRQFAQGNMLRVAAADVTGVIPLMVVSDYLTEIAEVSTERSLSIAWRDLARRHGTPPDTDQAHPGFAVLGYGKLGGIELGYNSDLDLVFIYDEAAAGKTTDGERAVVSEQFYVRLGQRLIHIMTTPTYSGVLYEVDVRLRPDGNKGMITRSLASFAQYQAGDAWTWEHQALVRARPVAGDAALGERFRAVRADILRREREPEQLRREVRDMRAKMRRSLDKTRGGLFDLKQGRGGIADVEFMVQYSVLRWASAYPELTDWTDNIRLLETLERLKLLPGDAAADLTAAYKALRSAYHRNALQDTPGLVPDDRLTDTRERVAELWRTLMEDAPEV